MNPVPVNVGNFPSMPYSQAVKVGDLLFIAGQIGVDFRSGKISDDFGTQARQAFENLATVLHSSGSNLEMVVKTTIWLQSATNFETLNNLYKEYFPRNAPARSTPIVNLPKPNLQISIEAIAVVK